ncbi:MAG: hypothetical protein B5M48_03090 [Candidatus Omnitrophica bacterium 4484_213]|nr:MAG: hypothetical protein B5M48_03090 [Candidatus Omnitrophica bacterium 4484_213]
MRQIKAKEIEDTVAQLCLEANRNLPKDVLAAIKEGIDKERGRPKKILQKIIENCSLAEREKLSLCQDTGLPIVFIDIGRNLIIKGDLEKAINRGIKEGYQKGYFRNSVVDPFLRKNPQSIPAVIHLNISASDKMKIALMPKGFGSENASATYMFEPTATIEEIGDWVVKIIKEKGANACPPLFIGIGIGGSLDKAVLLSKQALLRPVDKVNSRLNLTKLEQEFLTRINKLGIGPLGLGGRTTALRVRILVYPTHIAGLPVALNISCWALRRASRII